MVGLEGGTGLTGQLESTPGNPVVYITAMENDPFIDDLYMIYRNSLRWTMNDNEPFSSMNFDDLPVQNGVFFALLRLITRAYILNQNPGIVLEGIWRI